MKDYCLPTIQAMPPERGITLLFIDNRKEKYRDVVQGPIYSKPRLQFTVVIKAMWTLTPVTSSKFLYHFSNMRAALVSVFTMFS